MKTNAMIAVAMLAVLAVCSPAWAVRPYVVAPAPVVYGYWPAAPVYYPAPVARVVQMPVTTRVYMAPPVVAAPAPVIAASPIVEPAAVVTPAPVVVPAPVVYPYPRAVYYPAPVVRARVLYPGEPIRNTLKVVVP